MNAASLSPLVVALAIGNTIASLAIWQVVTAEPPQRIMIGVSDASVVHSAESQIPFQRIERQTGSTAARLFGPPAEISKAAEAAEHDVPHAEPAMRLVGVMLFDEPHIGPVALIEYGSPARVHRLKIGELIQSSGWKIERIFSASVDITKKDEINNLKIDQAQ